MKEDAAVMNDEIQLCLIEPDYRLRAALTSLFARGGLHIEPFECASELATMQKRPGVCFVRYDRQLLENLNRTMAATGNWKAVVCYDEEPNPRNIVESVMAGACDFLTLPISDEGLKASITCAKICLAARNNDWQRRMMARALLDRLTPREKEVLESMVDGQTNRLIGSNLRISPRTVEIHRANMISKLQAKNASEAIRIAVEAR